MRCGKKAGCLYERNMARLDGGLKGKSEERKDDL